MFFSLCHVVSGFLSFAETRFWPTHEFLDKIQFLALLNLGGGVLYHVWRLCILFGGFVYCLGALYIVWELRIMRGSFSLRV